MKFRKRYSKHKNDIFDVTNEGARHINDDKSAQNLIQMHDRVLCDPTYHHDEVAIAMDTIAAIFIARSMDGDERYPASHLKNAIDMTNKELKTLEICVGMEQVRPKMTVEQIDELKKRVEEVQGA